MQSGTLLWGTRELRHAQVLFGLVFLNVFTQLHRTRDYSWDQSWAIEMPLAHWVDSAADLVRMGRLHSIKSGTIPSKTKLLSHQNSVA